jgi:hypothetical protein
VKVCSLARSRVSWTSKPGVYGDCGVVAQHQTKIHCSRSFGTLKTMCGKGPYLQKQQRFRMKERQLKLQVRLGQRASSCQPLNMKIEQITHACFSRRGRRRIRRSSGSSSSTRSGRSAGNGSSDFSCSSVIDEKILRENATLNIINGITRVALASVVVELCMSVGFFSRTIGANPHLLERRCRKGEPVEDQPR